MTKTYDNKLTFYQLKLSHKSWLLHWFDDLEDFNEEKIRTKRIFFKNQAEKNEKIFWKKIYTNNSDFLTSKYIWK